MTKSINVNVLKWVLGKQELNFLPILMTISYKLLIFNSHIKKILLIYLSTIERTKTGLVTY